MDNINDILEYAIRETTYLNDGEEFLLSDLFKGYEWKRVPYADRLLAGRIFRDYIGKIDGIVKPTGKTPSGNQQYKIIIKQNG